MTKKETLILTKQANIGFKEENKGAGKTRNIRYRRRKTH